MPKLSFNRARNEKLDRELPYAITLITLMASSGITPYESFRRLRDVDLLPATRHQSNEIARKVEVLGEDPLSAIEERATDSGSTAFQELLIGYVSTVRSGGSVVSYLKSKLRSVFDLQAALAKNAIERIGMIVDAYMGILIIALSSFAIAVSMTAIETPASSISSVTNINILILVVTPVISLLFIYLVHRLRESTIIGIDRMFRSTIFPVAGITSVIIAIYFLPETSFIIDMIGLPYLLGISLIVSLAPSMIKYERMARLNEGAEKAMPRLIRSVVETRKTGLSPIRCIIQAARVKNYGRFTKRMNTVADQLEWGLPLRKVILGIKEEIRSKIVLLNIFILLEVVETGGGLADTLEALADSSEKIQNIEEEKRNMLRPYIVLPIVVTALLAFTTIVLIQSFVRISEQPLPQVEQLTVALSVGIIIQSWITGFFIGKVTAGSFAAGFKYAMMLVGVALASIFLTTNVNIHFGVLLEG